MKKFIFENGQEAYDVVTGFKGIITQRVDYLTGCNQYYLVQQCQDGNEPKARWVDEPRLKLVKNGKRIDLAKDGTKCPEPGGTAEAYPSKTM